MSLVDMPRRLVRVEHQLVAGESESENGPGRRQRQAPRGLGFGQRSPFFLGRL